MSKKSVLIVGGTFDNNGGKASGLITKIYNETAKRNDVEIVLFNGGSVEDLHTSIIEKCKESQITLWMPNVPNTEEKIRNVKEVNPRTILISSKRNDDNKYSFAELISRALAMKSNLTIEFSKIKDNKFNMMVFDPLGNSFFKGTDVEKMVKALFDRAIKLTEFTRCPTYKVETDEVPEVPEQEEFFKFARNCSEIFHNLINPSKDTTRFLGNMSFRCQNGFPSFRGDDGLVFVSRRNVDKSQITKESFVPAYLDENDNTMYYGDNKPSVDTPVQLRLYKKFPEFNYMIHAHCYFDAPFKIAGYSSFTYNPVPCGAIEEVDEISWAIANEVDEDYYEKETDIIAVNLIGHGCLLMAKTVESFTKLMTYKNNCFKKRPMPEDVFGRIKQDTFNMFGIKRHMKNLKFTQDKNLTLKEFKQKLYRAPDNIAGMVEDSYCCHGIFHNCWEELYETGVWMATRKQTNKTLIETYKRALENYPDRIFTATRSGRTYIAIVLRDIEMNDYRIFI